MCVSIVDGVGGNVSVGAVLERLSVFIGTSQGPDLGVVCGEG